MFEKIENCPICDSPSFTNHLICEDHSISGESFAIVKCNNCDFLFTNPRPSQEVIHKYYESEDYISHSNKGNSLVNIAYKLVRNHTIKKKIKMIRGLLGAEPVRILDVGSGTGEFLKACSNKGWETIGVEPNQGARELATSYGLDIKSSLSEVKDQFNVITLWHVLEHLPDLNDTLKSLSKLLKKNGKLIIAVPNNESYDAKEFGAQWAGYDVPRHFYHFTQDSIRKLFKNHNLKLSKTLPMKFDSYYVSMLSNRYQTGSNKYLKSILTGYKSNSYASKNNNNYSSLIYIVNK